MVDQPRTRNPEPRDWREPPRAEGRFEPRLEQRLDQWMTAGRQLVDGVAGARPGSRPSARSAGSRAGSGLRLDHLGRWVEDKLDWLLEDDDGWREPWQEAPPQRQPPQRQPAPARPVAPAAPSRRRPLEAVSRRGAPLLPPQADQDWPDDASFSVNRWRRDAEAGPPARDSAPPSEPPSAPPSEAVPPQGRVVPRSSRRRPG